MRREFLIARILSLDIELVPVPKLAEIMHQVNEIYNETLCNTQINCKLSIFLDKRSSKKNCVFLGLIPKPPPPFGTLRNKNVNLALKVWF